MSSNVLHTAVNIITFDAVSKFYFKNCNYFYTTLGAFIITSIKNGRLQKIMTHKLIQIKWEYCINCIDCLSKKTLTHSLSHKTFFLRKCYPASSQIESVKTFVVFPFNFEYCNEQEVVTLSKIVHQEVTRRRQTGVFWSSPRPRPQLRPPLQCWQLLQCPGNLQQLRPADPEQLRRSWQRTETAAPPWAAEGAAPLPDLPPPDLHSPCSGCSKPENVNSLICIHNVGAVFVCFFGRVFIQSSFDQPAVPVRGQE